MSVRPLVLTIGALETSGQEGVVGDAAVIAELDGRPACVATGLSLVPGSELVPLGEDLVEAQLAAALVETPRAIRVGAVPSPEGAARIAAALLARAPEGIVLAPELLEESRPPLLSLATVVIVRPREARDLEALKSVAAGVRASGARAVLVAGASVHGRVVDLLDDGGTLTAFDAPRLAAPRIAGLTGAHATALAAHLARGESLVRACEAAQRYVGLRLRRGR